MSPLEDFIEKIFQQLQTNMSTGKQCGLSNIGTQQLPLLAKLVQ